VSWLSGYKAKRAASQVERKAKGDSRRAKETARKARVDQIAELLLTGSFVDALQTQGDLPAYAGSLEEALGRRGIKPPSQGSNVELSDPATLIRRAFDVAEGDRSLFETAYSNPEIERLNALYAIGAMRDPSLSLELEQTTFLSEVRIVADQMWSDLIVKASSRPARA
jgi:hypothetical protein